MVQTKVDASFGAVYFHTYGTNGIDLNAPFNPSEQTYVITHGLTNTGGNPNNNYTPAEWITQTAQALRSRSPNANIIITDWESGVSSLLNYGASATRTVETGKLLGSELLRLGANPNKTELIGHSLGAHVSGAAGDQYKTLTGNSISQITGLDPAGPLFTNGRIIGYRFWIFPIFGPVDPNQRLDTTDANRVVTLNTSSTLGYYNTKPELGHSTILVNDNSWFQPGQSSFIGNHSYAYILHTSLLKNTFYPQDNNQNFNLNTLYDSNQIGVSKINTYNPQTQTTLLRAANVVTEAGLSVARATTSFAAGSSTTLSSFVSTPSTANLPSLRANNVAFITTTYQITEQMMTQYPGGLIGSDQSEEFIGSPIDDVLFGLGGDDILKGGLGDDYLRGGRDNDQLIGGEGDDLLNGNQNDDMLSGGAGNDIVRGDQGNDQLFGDEGDDILISDGGSDRLTGGVGSDIFILTVDTSKFISDPQEAPWILDFNSTEQDIIFITDTIDTNQLTLTTLDVNQDNINDTVILYQETSPIFREFKDIFGVVINTPSDIVENALFSLPEGDPILALGDSDELSPDGQILFGQSSLNTSPTATQIPVIKVFSDNPNQTIELGQYFDDTEDLDTELTYDLIDNSNPDLFDAVGFDPNQRTLTLNYGDNKTGTSQITLEATDIDGASVQTTFTVQVEAPPIPILVFGSSNSDQIEPTVRSIIFAGAGIDTVDASLSISHNRLFGQSDNDDLYGKNNDMLSGGSGDDTLTSMGEGNRLEGNEGNDKIFVTKSDRAFGGTGDDEFYALNSMGNNRIYGGSGNDNFYLGSGDRLIGDEGNDKFFVTTGGNNTITGGEGLDEFWVATGGSLFNTSETPNIITDFTIAQDLIKFGGNFGSNLDSFSDLTLTTNQGNTTIRALNRDLVILNGINATNLTASNFMFVA